MQKLFEDYQKILDAFKPMISALEETKKVIEPLSKVTLEISKSLQPTSDSTKMLESITAGMQPLIKTVELTKLGIDSRSIAKLVEAGYLERVRQGYYRINDEASNEAQIIKSLFPDGVICMYSALFHYGYSDRTPLNWDIAIDRNVSKARFNVDYPYVKPYYMEKTHLKYGICICNYDGTNLNIFDRDRLICECIKHENKMDKETYNKAIQGYINDSKKNISKLLEYAKKRNILNKVKNRIEVWL